MKIKTIILITMLFSLVGCATLKYKDPAEEFAGMSAEEIYLAGERELAAGNYKQAVNYFEGLDALYPFERFVRQARIDVIYAHYMRGEFAEAQVTAERFIRLYPRDKNIDYVYYMRGIAFLREKRGLLHRIAKLDPASRDVANLKQAYQDFDYLQTRFPNSQYTPDARQHMVYLRNLLAKHELLIAEFYMDRKAFVAANNRASEIIQHYPSSAYVADALAIQVQANRELNLPQAAEEALRVLRMNFPERYTDLNAEVTG
jgi:outer membrane protein assembly factor BamD